MKYDIWNISYISSFVVGLKKIDCWKDPDEKVFMQALEKFNNDHDFFVSLEPILEKYLYFLLPTSVGSETSILSDLNTVFTSDLFYLKPHLEFFK